MHVFTDAFVGEWSQMIIGIFMAFVIASVVLKSNDTKRAQLLRVRAKG